MSGEDYGEASRAQWGSAAEAWARAAEEPERGAAAEVAVWMLEAADLSPGQRVLELACGAGRVGLQAAPAVAPDGHVLCSDFAEPMVAAVRRRAAKSGLENVDARVLDAERLELSESERFDRVLCRFGYMLMGDPQAALRESRGALSAQGRLVLAVWGTAAENPWLTTILEAVMGHFDAPPPQPGMPGPFALSDPERLDELLRSAGFDDSEVTPITTEQRYESALAWWEHVTAVGGPLAAVLSALEEADRSAIRERALGEAAAFVEDGGEAVFPASVLGAVGKLG